MLLKVCEFPKNQLMAYRTFLMDVNDTIFVRQP